MNNKCKLGDKGSVLIMVMTFVLILTVAVTGLTSLCRYHQQKETFRANRMDAFYTAENALLEGTQYLADQITNPSAVIGIYSKGDASHPLIMPYTLDSKVQYCSMRIEPDPMGVQDNFRITATATIGGETRNVRALVRWHPPSIVFDYEYFLNNWGWWWGSGITGYGDQRTNWDFDFKDNPTVNGNIFAYGEVQSNHVTVNPFSGTPPFLGIAGMDPITYCHVGAPLVNMPNLRDLTYYESEATGKISKAGVTLVNKVYGDDEPKQGIYLEGTADNPLVINGSVVIRGDVIIKGYITGQGTIYIGGNLYVAGNVQYANGPGFSPPPESMTITSRDAWVDTNISKDLVAFAVRESIFAGLVNSSTWKSGCYDNTSYGLKYVGSEATLGADGIRSTPDDGVSYLDTNGDGIADSAWYDADGDGVIDANYNYDTQIKMTSTRIANIANYPIDSTSGLPVDYNLVSTDQFTTLEGVYYTNHALGVLNGNGPDYIDGAIICRDEAWIFSGSLKFRYDSRIHSRYQEKYFNGDPSRIIDLGLPIVEQVRIIDRYEMKPSKTI